MADLTGYYDVHQFLIRLRDAYGRYPCTENICKYLDSTGLPERIGRALHTPSLHKEFINNSRALVVICEFGRFSNFHYRLQIPDEFIIPLRSGYLSDDFLYEFMSLDEIDTCKAFAKKEQDLNSIFKFFRALAEIGYTNVERRSPKQAKEFLQLFSNFTKGEEATKYQLIQQERFVESAKKRVPNLYIQEGGLKYIEQAYLKLSFEGLYESS